MRAHIALALSLALAACSLRSDAVPDQAPQSPCKPVQFEDTPLTHCIIDPALHRIGVDLGPDGRKPYGSLSAFASANKDEQQAIALVMNAGMYDEDLRPIGYFVEDGERLKPINQNEGPGNFHLLPNGIFFGQADGGWQVLSTGNFIDEVKQRPDFATQSGPMLVIGGELHPDIAPDGESLKLRNAVGVDLAGRAHLLISEAPISFGRLARYYRDVLKVPNALFLDGSVSQIWDPARGRMDGGPDIGPLIVVRHREEAASEGKASP